MKVQAMFEAAPSQTSVTLAVLDKCAGEPIEERNGPCGNRFHDVPLLDKGCSARQRVFRPICGFRCGTRFSVGQFRDARFRFGPAVHAMSI